MRETRTYGSVRGALSNERPYRDHLLTKEMLEKAWLLRLWLGRRCRFGSWWRAWYHFGLACGGLAIWRDLASLPFSPWCFQKL